MLNLVVSLNILAVDDHLVEVVLFELVDFDALAKEALMEESLVLSQVAALFRESDVVQLADVAHVVDCGALLELVWQLFHVLSVADGQDYSRDVVVLASCQLFTHTTDADDLTKRGNFTSQGKVGGSWSVDGT